MRKKIRCTKKRKIAIFGPGGSIYFDQLACNGGVDRYCRQLYQLNYFNEEFEFQVFSAKQVFRLIWWNPQIVHLNFTMPFKRIFGTIFFRLLKKTVINTVHSNWISWIEIFDRLAFYYSHLVIVVNPKLASSTKDWGNVIEMTPLFGDLPINNQLRITRSVEVANDEIKTWIRKQRDQFGLKVGLLYASSNEIRHGKEVYGVSWFLSHCHNWSDVAFIFIDVNDSYPDLDLDSSMPFLHVRAGVDMNELLTHIDFYLRPTTTDGNSVLILEALQAGITVFASSVVVRPTEVVTFDLNNPKALGRQIEALGSGAQLSTIFSSYKVYLAALRKIVESRRGENSSLTS